jgi:hypothetical protein
MQRSSQPNLLLKGDVVLIDIYLQRDRMYHPLYLVS